MITIISPAKTLDFETPPVIAKSTKPLHLQDSTALVDLMREYNPEGLVELMGISQKLGELNYQRFHEWHTPFTKDNAKQAIYAFKGDVYTGLDAEQLSKDDVDFAQSHLRILSGLYGVLRPLDLIQPYRLEMGTKVENPKGKNLYDFWDDRLTNALNKQLKAVSAKALINLASNEYFKVLAKGQLSTEIITPVFKDFKSGKYKIVSFFAKKARGMMAAYIIQNKITEPSKLKKFNVAGYQYDEASSTATEWVFLRKEIKDDK